MGKKHAPTPLGKQLCEEFTTAFDTRTLDAAISKRDAAEIALDIAAEFKERAAGLTDEANHDEVD